MEEAVDSMAEWADSKMELCFSWWRETCPSAEGQRPFSFRGPFPRDTVRFRPVHRARAEGIPLGPPPRVFDCAAPGIGFCRSTNFKGKSFSEFIHNGPIAP